MYLKPYCNSVQTIRGKKKNEKKRTYPLQQENSKPAGNDDTRLKGNLGRKEETHFLRPNLVS